VSATGLPAVSVAGEAEKLTTTIPTASAWIGVPAAKMKAIARESVTVIFEVIKIIVFKVFLV
jgi:hypothetical protein